MDIQFTTQILSSALISCCTIHMADSCVQNGVSELNRAYWVVSCNPLKSSIICLSIAIAGYWDLEEVEEMLNTTCHDLGKERGAAQGCKHI
ncbi:unnamed protein product [Sphagnum troendelagicum]